MDERRGLPIQHAKLLAIWAISFGGSRGSKPFAMRKASNARIDTTSIDQASGLEL